MARKIPLTLQMPPEILDELERFAAVTKRTAPDVIRAALELFVGDGMEAMEKRLTAGLWELDSGSKRKQKAG